MALGGSQLAMTGWGVYDNVLHDYLASRRPPRFASEREIFTFFVRLWKDLRKRYSFVDDQVAEDDRSPFADLDSSFLVGNRHGIFHVSGDMSVMAFHEYYASAPAPPTRSVCCTRSMAASATPGPGAPSLRGRHRVRRLLRRRDRRPSHGVR